MEENKYEVLKLKNQICFPIYAVSNKIIRKYKPLLDDLDLTYKGESLKEKAVNIPTTMACEMKLSSEKAQMLYSILYELLNEDNIEEV